MATIFLIINGKKADIPKIREAVDQLRKEGNDIHVRVTWEHGDGVRYVEEASTFHADRIIAGGGDGTVNEIAHGLALLDAEKVPAMGILPLGTANDFAAGCNIPMEPFAALKLAVSGDPVAIDLVRANDRYVVNVASAGFGAAVTAETPTELKNFLAGGAYTLMGIIKILNFSSYPIRIKSDHYRYDGESVIGVICNGRQAGGGQILAPNGYINDGLFDVLFAKSFPISAINQVIAEVQQPSPDGEFVVSVQGTWLEFYSDVSVPVNLDGEPISCNKIHFDIVPGAINLVVPKDCPCIRK